MKKLIVMLAVGLLFAFSTAFTCPAQKCMAAESQAVVSQETTQNQGVVDTVLNGAEEAWKTWIYPAIIGVGSSATLVGIVGLCLRSVYKRRKKKADASLAESEKSRAERDKKRDEALARLLESNAQFSKALTAYGESAEKIDANLLAVKKSGADLNARISTVTQILSAVYSSSDALSPEIRQYVVAKALEGNNESDR